METRPSTEGVNKAPVSAVYVRRGINATFHMPTGVISSRTNLVTPAQDV
ncbi:hypothetical protein E2C01_011585 [Portunus trituberculatus]|uniref:Uncharacterized protein n=1 Tax=Portunus trituberculatus TaxID=210409 RepID=A0A5B7DCD3_PORTR|nr:hypothetical protein [Portunus trituberculatus]